MKILPVKLCVLNVHSFKLAAPLSEDSAGHPKSSPRERYERQLSLVLHPPSQLMLHGSRRGFQWEKSMFMGTELLSLFQS